MVECPALRDDRWVDGDSQTLEDKIRVESGVSLIPRPLSERHPRLAGLRGPRRPVARCGVESATTIEEDSVSSADEWIQQLVNRGGKGLPMTAESLAELLVRLSMYGIAVRDEQEPVMGVMWGHVVTLVDKLREAAGLEVNAVNDVYRAEVARLGLPID